MSMDNFLNELEEQLKNHKVPYERYKLRDCDEWIAYPSRKTPRYAYQIVRCPCCGKVREANLFDYTSKGGPPNCICCTPESAYNYIMNCEEEDSYGSTSEI